MKDSEIVLLSDSYALTDITSPTARDRLVSTLSRLDSRLLSEKELREYFDSLRLAMGMFIQKVNGLESDIFDLRREQVASESRMESMYLKAQLEIQGLKQEITEIKLSKGRINQIVKVAQALQGNAYAPYAIKSLVDKVVGSNAPLIPDPAIIQSNKLPTDYAPRLEFAQLNGFKWNQNNREPAKTYKKLKLLEEWEDQFMRTQSLSLEQILDKKYVSGLGAGAIAGALMYLEKQLDRTLEERSSLSVFNCYQKAIRLYKEKRLTEPGPVPVPNPAQEGNNYYALVSACFSYLPDEQVGKVAKRLESRKLGTAVQVVSCLKKLISKEMLPDVIEYAKEHASESSKLYAVQSGYYDPALLQAISTSGVLGISAG